MFNDTLHQVGPILVCCPGLSQAGIAGCQWVSVFGKGKREEEEGGREGGSLLAKQAQKNPASRGRGNPGPHPEAPRGW